MANNRANRLIPQPIVDKVMEALKSIKAELEPYNIPLTAEERKELFKMGDKSIGFVNKAGDYMDTNPEFVTFFMDVAAFKIDLKNVNNLSPMYKLAEQVFTMLGDMLMIGGHEAIDVVMDYYSSVKSAAHSAAPNAKVIYEDLNVRFPGRKRKKEPLPNS